MFHYWENGCHFWKEGEDMNKVYDKMLKPIDDKELYMCGESFSKKQAWIEGALETSYDVFENIKNNNDKLYKQRINRIKSVNLRSKLNHFAFHLKNPLSIFFRNACLRYLTKSEKFLENYLGKVYRD